MRRIEPRKILQIIAIPPELNMKAVYKDPDGEYKSPCLMWALVETGDGENEIQVIDHDADTIYTDVADNKTFSHIELGE